MRIFVEYRDERYSAGGPAVSGAATLILGTDNEWPVTPDRGHMAEAVSLDYDLENGRIEVRTSIVGLPAVFFCRSPSRLVIASDLWLMRSVPGVDFAFDRDGVRDFFRIGYPIGFRTLFQGIGIVPGGHRMVADTHGSFDLKRTWTAPAEAPLASWKEYTDLQIDLFGEAFKRIDLNGAVLSLTAGLDTRTILAALVKEHATIPACTMSWRDASLDARTAAALCRAYGIEHEIVRFDGDFARQLPGHALTSSRLSGGLASVGQATEVAFYERMAGRRYRSRLSGYLGNQVGRGGVEQVSLRNGKLALLGPAVQGAGTLENSNHWFYREDRRGEPLDLAFRFQQEAMFSQVGNYGIGNHFMVQASPYASRALIESVARTPKDSTVDTAPTIRSMRLRDLRHRFFGEPDHRSFQRQLIRAAGGRVARYPINWGWRASGGISPKGAALGMLTLVDALAESRGLNGNTLVGRALTALRITGLHDFRRPRRWLIRDYVHDTLQARDLLGDGILDRAAVEGMLKEHFSDERDRHGDLMLAMDLAHAYRVFVAARRDTG